MSLHSHTFIKNIHQHLHVDGNDPPDIQYVDSCYLFLASERREKVLRENYEIQKSVGAEVELLSPKQLKELYPWMSVHDVVLGCRGVCVCIVCVCVRERGGEERRGEREMSVECKLNDVSVTFVSKYCWLITKS